MAPRAGKEEADAGPLSGKGQAACLINEQPVQKCQEHLEGTLGMSFICNNMSLLMMLLIMQPKLLAETVMATHLLGVHFSFTAAASLDFLLMGEESRQDGPLQMEMRPIETSISSL